MRCGENWTSLIHTWKETVLDLDEALLILTFIIWKCLWTSFEVFIVICMLIA